MSCNIPTVEHIPKQNSSDSTSYDCNLSTMYMKIEPIPKTIKWLYDLDYIVFAFTVS